MKVNEKHITDRIITKENKQFSILKYDDNNIYPQNIEKIINGSGTAKNCTDRLSSFLKGKGFTNKVIQDLKINNTNESFYKLFSQCINDFVKFRGFAVWRKINQNSKSVEFYHVPFSYVRKCYSDDSDDYTAQYVIYNNWDKSHGQIKYSDFQYAWAFSDNEDIIMEQIVKDGSIDNYSGQLYYFSADGDKYPLAYIDSIQEDCIVDNQIKVFNYKNITTNFMASHFVLFANEPEEHIKKEIEQSLKLAQSAENASKILSMWGMTEQDFKLIKIDVQNHDKLFEVTNTTTKDNIRERFGQNLPFFKGGMTSSDMSGEAIKTTYNFYNALTEAERNEICEVFSELLKTWYKPILADVQVELLTFGV